MRETSQCVVTLLFFGILSGLVFLVGKHSERARVLRILQKYLQENAARMEEGTTQFGLEQFYKMQAYNKVREQMLE